MSLALPFRYEGDGEFRVTGSAWARQADERYVVGAVYRLEPHEDRSFNSHRHFFASIAEAWSNLPELLAQRFATPEHLRKYALVQCGYRDERSIVCASHAEALRVRAFVEPMDDFAVVVTSECVVTVYTAKSQSMKAMGRRPFQDSKQAVLDYIAGMIGVEPAALAAHTQDRAA